MDLKTKIKGKTILLISLIEAMEIPCLLFIKLEGIYTGRITYMQVNLFKKREKRNLYPVKIYSLTNFLLATICFRLFKNPKK
jgi:hypothetical protein